ncbi:45783_t:CDS:2, partial [Gigaspora margarita]
MPVKVEISREKRQLEVLQLFWHQSIHTAPELHKLTKIPGGSGRVKKITPTAAKTILQCIHKEPSIPLKNIASRLKKNKVQVHYSTISRYLK